MGLWLIWAILGAILLVNIALYGLFVPDDTSANGALVSLPIYCVVAGIITAARILPFALTVGLTRVRFYLASLLATMGLSVVWAAAVAALAQVEAATGGWGVNLAFFRLSGVLAGSALETFTIMLVGLFTAFVAGWCFGIVHSRWGLIGVLLACAIVLVVIAAVIVVAAAPQVLPALHQSLADLTVTGAVGLAAVLSVFLTALGFFFARRTAV